MRPNCLLLPVVAGLAALPVHLRVAAHSNPAAAHAAHMARRAGVRAGGSAGTAGS